MLIEIFLSFGNTSAACLKVPLACKNFVSACGKAASALIQAKAACPKAVLAFAKAALSLVHAEAAFAKAGAAYIYVAPKGILYLIVLASWRRPTVSPPVSPIVVGDLFLPT